MVCMCGKDKEVFKNNLQMLKEQKVRNIVALKRVAGLFALCRIFNQVALDYGNNAMLSSEHFCVHLSLNEIYQSMSKRTQKNYCQYKNGVAKINKELLRHDIRLLIICGVIRKVDFTDLVRSEQNSISKRKQLDAKNVYLDAPYYEVLDLKDSHFERLTKIKDKNISSYVVVQQMFSTQIADNCFNSISKDCKNGLDEWGKDTFSKIVEIIKTRKIISLKELSMYCANNFVLSNFKTKKQSYWYQQIRNFNFSDDDIVLCRNSELGKKKRLNVYNNSLVFITVKGCV